MEESKRRENDIVGEQYRVSYRIVIKRIKSKEEVTKRPYKAHEAGIYFL